MKKIFIFLAGAAIGSLVTWKLTEQHYKKIADEEIESVRDYYKSKEEDVEINEDKNPKDEEVVEISTNLNKIDTIIRKEGYALGADFGKGESVSVETMINNCTDVPYEISEDEYGEFGNEEKTLIYYADFQLADEDDDPITDPESVVGDTLKKFAEDPYLERIYVRDEVNEIDYIILKSEKSYSELFGEEEN